MAKEGWRSWGKSGGDAMPFHEADMALEILSKAQGIEPQNPEVHRWLGYVYQQKGLLDMAEGPYLEALRLDSSNLAYWNLLAAMYAEKEEFSKADFVLRQALQKSPDHKDILKNLAVINLYHLSDSASAKQYLYKYVSQNPTGDFDVNTLRKELARVVWNEFNSAAVTALKEDALSFRDYEVRRVELQNNIRDSRGREAAQYHEQLGILYFQRGMEGAAITELYKALHITPSLLSATRVLSLIQASKNEFEQVIGILKRASKKNPKDSFISKNLGLLMKYYKDDGDEALKYFDKYLRGNRDYDERKVYSEAQELKN